MVTVYMVWHFDKETLEDDEQEKLIGAYSTEERAKEAIERLRDKPGFRDFPERWEIYEGVEGNMQWTTGFFTVYPGDRPWEQKREQIEHPPHKLPPDQQDKPLTAVYFLYHIDENDAGRYHRGKFIGVFSTPERARNAIDLLRHQHGFRDFPERWKFYRRTLDRDSWTEGFVPETHERLR